MRKTKLKIISLWMLLITCTLSFSTSFFAMNTDNNTSDSLSKNNQPIPSQDSSYSNYAYLLDTYDVRIIVNEDNTLTIIETIDAYFNVPKHGIIRSILLKNNVKRLDGTSSTNRVKIKDMYVNTIFSTSTEMGDVDIKIGDSNEYLVGSQSYTIKYVYDMGQDKAKNYDEFYFNIIGSDWDTAIGGITFAITMPKAFDVNKLGFSYGILGSLENEGITYQVINNVISGSFDGILNPNEALSVRVELA
jgi:hypothetical protein